MEKYLAVATRRSGNQDRKWKAKFPNGSLMRFDTEQAAQEYAERAEAGPEALYDARAELEE
jgi:hypothetical protein